MPITQDRMIAVLSAYRAVLDYYAKTRTELDAVNAGIRANAHAKAHASVQAGDYPTALKLILDAYDNLATQTTDILRGASETLLSAHMILYQEEAHFKLRRKYNDRKRVAQRDARDADRELMESHLAKLNPKETMGVPPTPPIYDATDDGIPEIGPEYTREDYDRERAERRKRDAERQASATPSVVKST